jgi:hypothetical protein
MESTTFDASNATWNLTRTSDHLQGFVTSRLALLTDVEL